MKKEFDKYAYYLDSVQSPEEDVLFFRKVFKEVTGRPAVLMREDFCGAFALSCAWVKLDPSHKAVGVDLDPEPLEYGVTHYLGKLAPSAQDRLMTLRQDVLKGPHHPADLVIACNFSYFCFKQRATLLNYLKLAYESIKGPGMLVLDVFGGPNCHEANEEETEHDDFSYFWDQDSYNPITNEAQFYIHYKRKGEAKRERVFSYDWRMWSIPELRDLLAEAGFSQSLVYWEGSDEDGEGNGEFTATEVGDECETWLAYIVGVKK